MPASSKPPTSEKSFEQILDAQKHLSDRIGMDTGVDKNTLGKLDPDTLKQLSDALTILRALLVPPLDACNQGSDWSVRFAKFGTVATNLIAVNGYITSLVGPPGSGAGGAGDKMANDATTLAAIQADIDLFASAAGRGSEGVRTIISPT